MEFTFRHLDVARVHYKFVIHTYIWTQSDTELWLLWNLLQCNMLTVVHKMRFSHTVILTVFRILINPLTKILIPEIWYRQTGLHMYNCTHGAHP
jgi:hypothetical protein